MSFLTDDGVFERSRAGARAGAVDSRQQAFDQPPNALVVVVEHPDDLADADGPNARRTVNALHQPRVVVGDQRDIDVTHLELARERRLRILGHIDHFPALLRKPLTLRAGRKAWALNHDDGPAFVDGDAQLAADRDAVRAQVGTVGLRGRDVHHPRTIVERLLARIRAIDELVAHHEVAGFDVWLQAARGGRRDDARDAQLGHGPQIGSVVDRVWRNAVVRPMARQKGDAHVAHPANGDAFAGRAEGGLYGHLFDRALHQAVKA